MTLIKRFILTALIVLGAADVIAQETEYTVEQQIERFQLFTGCAPMRLLVEGLPPGAGQIGLTEGAITRAVESRLRSARLYTSDGEYFNYYTLYVQVGVLDLEGRWRSLPYSVDIYFQQRLYNSRVEHTGTAKTWHTGSYGQGGSQFILGSISEHMDKFLTEYLRVNEAACNTR